MKIWFDFGLKKYNKIVMKFDLSLKNYYKNNSNIDILIRREVFFFFFEYIVFSINGEKYIYYCF